MTDPQASSTPPQTTPNPAVLRVLIAEDEALIRLDLAEMLGEEGYDVVAQAADGEQAVALAVEHRPDLVIMDVKMPKLDGIAAASQIAAARIAPVVMLTAFSQRELVDRAREAGAMAYLVKPFSKSDLVPAIEIARSRFAEITQLESEVADLTGQVATRKAVERAKAVLQEALGISEPDAFRW
ncbi:MAG: response regulator, partial [Actinomycetota bacterium]|nr:response regulator [Actinomycetota bacterium]